MKKIFITALASLIIFYVGAILITGKLLFTDMPTYDRQVIFGIWLAICVISGLVITIDNYTKNI